MYDDIFNLNDNCIKLWIIKDSRIYRYMLNQMICFVSVLKDTNSFIGLRSLKMSNCLKKDWKS